MLYYAGCAHILAVCVYTVYASHVLSLSLVNDDTCSCSYYTHRRDPNHGQCQAGSLTGAVHLSKGNAGVLRLAQ